MSVAETAHIKTYFDHIYEHASQSIIILDGEGRFICTNRSFDTLTGYDRGELAGRSFMDIVIAEEAVRSASGSRVFEFFQCFTDQPLCIELIGKAQEKIPVLLSMKIVRNSSGQITEAMGIMDYTASDKGAVDVLQRIKKAQETMYNILRNIGDAVVYADCNGLIIFVNVALTRLLGYSAGELSGKHFFDFLPGEGTHEATTGKDVIIDEEYLRERIEEARELYEKGRVASEIYYMKKDGTVVPVEATYSVLKDQGNEPYGTIGVYRDITERKRLEEAYEKAFDTLDDLTKEKTRELLKANELLKLEINQRSNMEAELRGTRDYLDSIIESSLDSIIVCDRSGQISRANKSFLEILGLAEDRVKGMLIYDFIPAAAGQYLSTCGAIVTINDQFQSDIRKTRTSLQETGVVRNWVTCLLLTDKKVIPVEFNFSHLTKDGELAGMVGIMRDITERKRAERLIKESWELYSTVLDNTPDMIFLANRNGTVNFANLAAQKHYVFSVSSSSKHFKFYWNDDSVERVQSGLDYVIRDKKSLTIDCMSGDTYYELSLNPFVHDDEVVSIVCVARNISMHKDMEEALKQAKERTEAMNRQLEEAVKNARIMARQADEANRSKTTFLTRMSHELRTPLNAIIGFAELILCGRSLEKNRTYGGLIITESEVLLELINDLLDIAKVEAGRLCLEILPFDLERILHSLYSSLAVQAKQKGLDFSFDIEEKTPVRLVGDPARLRQVLVNLIGNAIKFTEKGTVRVAVRQVDECDGKAILHFAITDTGIGIKKEKKEEIFKSFVQADESTTRKYGGTGLGTTIAKQLVGLMGGEIGLESEYGKGSTFWFSIPFEKRYATTLEEEARARADTAPPAAEPEEPETRVGTILLVEDYPPNLEIAAAHLTNAGYTVTCAENGQKAVEAADQKKFDLIIMDVQMPKMDGLQATIRIRESSRLNSTTPIIAMTANAYQRDHERCTAAGMNDVITKPLRKKEFLAKIDGLMRAAARDMNDQRPCPPETQKTADEVGNQPMDYRHALEEFGGNAAFLNKVLGMFFKNADSQLVSMSAALEQGNLEVLRRNAHSIKGGAGNLAARTLWAAAQELEQLSTENKAEGCKQAMKKVLQEYTALKSYVNELVGHDALSGEKPPQ